MMMITSTKSLLLSLAWNLLGWILNFFFACPFGKKNKFQPVEINKKKLLRHYNIYIIYSKWPEREREKKNAQ